MAKSKLIKDLIEKQISTESCIERLYLIGLELDAIEIQRWCEAELRGYNQDVDVPNYRVIGRGEIRYSGLKGNMTIKGATLQAEVFDKELNDLLNNNKIRESISAIQEISSTGKSFSISLYPFIGYVYKKTGIQCLSLDMIYPTAQLKGLLSNVRINLIKALIKLVFITVRRSRRSAAP